MKVTAEQLLSILAGLRPAGAKFVALTTLTYPDLLKKNRKTKEPCPHPQGVSRLAQRTVVLGCCYEAAVQREREMEGNRDEFIADKLWGGAGVKHGPYTVMHSGSGRIYFNVRPYQIAVDESVSPQGRVAPVVKDEWRDVATGAIVDPATLADFLPLKYDSETQDVDHDVLWRTIALDSVVELRYGGEVYQLTPKAKEGVRPQLYAPRTALEPVVSPKQEAPKPAARRGQSMGA